MLRQVHFPSMLDTSLRSLLLSEVLISVPSFALLEQAVGILLTCNWAEMTETNKA
jgi:hypothetical protein